MSNNIYNEGAVHNDYHQETNIQINGNVSTEIINNLAASFLGKGEKTEETKQSKKKSATRNSNVERTVIGDYSVFSKGKGVTEDHINGVYIYLTSANINCISTQTSKGEFQRLFNGKQNNCKIIWNGGGVTKLYTLFVKLKEKGLINTSDNAIHIGPILEHHFVDSHDKYLTNVSNRKHEGKFKDIINEVIHILELSPDNESIEEYVKKSMESRLTLYDR